MHVVPRDSLRYRWTRDVDDVVSLTSSNDLSEDADDHATLENQDEVSVDYDAPDKQIDPRTRGVYRLFVLRYT